ncbi:MAG: DUF3791 domain-containing protein [Treponema sp.]|nr:DUF3791 domain-containing protein [Treponema sp.]
MSKDTFEFVIYMLHACAAKWTQLPSVVYKKLKDSECISKFLVPYYNVLHTQGTAFVISDIEEYLEARGFSI